MLAWLRSAWLSPSSSSPLSLKALRRQRKLRRRQTASQSHQVRHGYSLLALVVPQYAAALTFTHAGSSASATQLCTPGCFVFM